MNYSPDNGSANSRRGTGTRFEPADSSSVTTARKCSLRCARERASAVLIAVEAPGGCLTVK